MWLYFLQGAALALPTALTPSPFKVFLMSQALRSGFRRAAPIAFAPLITDGFIILLVVFALTQLPQIMLDFLRLGGGFFLCYLAIRLLGTLRRPGPTLQASPQAAGQNFFQAVFIILLNPNPYIFWGVVAGPILVQGLQQGIRFGLSFVTGFYTVFIGGLVVLVFVFATAGRLDERVNKILIGVAALGMLTIGLMQITSGGRALLGL